MLDNVNATIIDATVKSYMSDESVTIDEAISDENDLIDIKTTVMLNIFEEAKKIDKYRKATLKDMYANKIVLTLIGKINSILPLSSDGIKDEKEYNRLVEILKRDIEELKKDKKTLKEIKNAIKRLLYAGTLQCNSRISLLLKLLNDKRISMVEYYNHEHTMVECSSSGITYVSNKEVINDIESSNRDIMKLKKSLGLEEK